MNELTHQAALVFTAYLPAMKSRMAHFWKSLSEDERKRVENFRTLNLKERYILSHGILRSLLSFYCQIPAEAIRFGFHRYGKPYLLDKPSVQFNMSHSHDFAAYIIALEHEVGIDIEWKNNRFNIDEMALQLLSPLEMKEFARSNPTEKIDTFYEIWAKKEAITKAMGKGLSYPMKAIEILNSLPSTVFHKAKADKFYFVSFSSFSNVAGAIAIKNNIPAFTHHHIQSSQIFAIPAN